MSFPGNIASELTKAANSMISKTTAAKTYFFWLCSNLPSSLFVLEFSEALSFWFLIAAILYYSFETSLALKHRCFPFFRFSRKGCNHPFRSSLTSSFEQYKLVINAVPKNSKENPESLHRLHLRQMYYLRWVERVNS